MDTMSKIVVGLGLAGAAVITGAGIQAAIDERSMEHSEMRQEISDLKSKVRSAEYEITKLESADDRLRNSLNEVNQKLNRHIIDESVKKKD